MSFVLIFEKNFRKIFEKKFEIFCHFYTKTMAKTAKNGLKWPKISILTKFMYFWETWFFTDLTLYGLQPGWNSLKQPKFWFLSEKNSLEHFWIFMPQHHETTRSFNMHRNRPKLNSWINESKNFIFAINSWTAQPTTFRSM